MARGFTQVEGLNYFETYAPVVRVESLRTMLAIAVQKNLVVHQMDVVSAYLAGELQEEVFMEIPEGLDAQDHVYRLRKGYLRP